MNWLPLGMGPEDYAAYLLFSALVWWLVGLRWWLAPLLFAGLLLWPYAFRFIGWAWRRFWVKTRAAARSPGALCCPECGSALEPAAAGPFSLHACPSCEGKWCGSAALAEGIAKKKKIGREWKEYKEKAPEEHSCPRCGAALEYGSFLGSNYTTFRCAPCDGYWFNRIDWVSFALSLD